MFKIINKILERFRKPVHHSQEDYYNAEQGPSAPVKMGGPEDVVEPEPVHHSHKEDYNAEQVRPAPVKMAGPKDVVEPDHVMESPENIGYSSHNSLPDSLKINGV